MLHVHHNSTPSGHTIVSYMRGIKKRRNFLLVSKVDKVRVPE